jgi:hypothetical protein
MTRIVTTHYRYKRPPRKRKAVALEAPAIVRAGKRADLRQKSDEIPPVSPTPPANDDRKSAIVTVKRKAGRFGDAPDLTPEEHKLRGDAADALWRELVRRATAKDRP